MVLAFTFHICFLDIYSQMENIPHKSKNYFTKVANTLQKNPNKVHSKEISCPSLHTDLNNNNIIINL